jgi:VWFA-related protein
LLKTPQDTAKQMKDEDDAIELGLAMQKPSVGTMMMHHLQQFNAEQDSLSLNLRVQYTLSAFDQLARYLSGMPGRKNIMWLSGSFPVAVMPNPDLKDPTQAARDFSGAVNHTAGLLANARVAVYPIDARGLFPQPLSAPDIAGGSIARTPDRVAAAESADSSLHAEERLTLEQVAHATGGEAIYNTNDLKGALAEVDRTGAHYYTLAYAPSDKSQDNKLRRIEVRVHPGGYHLSYRRSYSPALAPAHDNSFLALMQHNVPASTQILFRLSPLRGAVQPATAQLAGSNAGVRRPVTRYSIAYDVDVTPLVLGAAADGVLHGQVTLVSIAYDRDGKALNSVANTLSVNVPSADYARFLKEGLHYREQLDIPVQAAWLRAGIYDHVSGQIGSLEVPLGHSKINSLAHGKLGDLALDIRHGESLFRSIAPLLLLLASLCLVLRARHNCAVRSFALPVAGETQAKSPRGQRAPRSLKTSLNDVGVERYHLLNADAKRLTDYNH